MGTIGFHEFRVSSAPRNKAAIVFVHGFTGDLVNTWRDIPKYLAADNRLNGWDLLSIGYETTGRPDLRGIWSSDAKLEEISKMVSGHAELSDEKYSTLAFVAHSMGGLVVQRALLDDEDLQNRTTRVVLFGTPSMGLKKAHFAAFWKRQIEEMDFGGPFLTDLRARWKQQVLDSTHPPFEFVAVAGESDQFVPPESSIGPFPKAMCRVIPGNHLTMLEADSAQHLSVQTILQAICGGSTPEGARSAANVAIEKAGFNEIIDQLWPECRQRVDAPVPKLDQYGAVQLALALEKNGDRAAAVQVLEFNKGRGTDVLGVLAGRFKRRWWLTSNPDDFAETNKLYQEAYQQSVESTPVDNDQAYYHGINLAYLALASDHLDAAREMATKVLDHVSKANLERLKIWRLPTEGDALMILGRKDEALERHRLAAAQKLEPWQSTSMEEQALRVAKLCGLDDKYLDELASAYEGKREDAHL